MAGKRPDGSVSIFGMVLRLGFTLFIIEKVLFQTVVAMFGFAYIRYVFVLTSFAFGVAGALRCKDTPFSKQSLTKMALPGVLVVLIGFVLSLIFDEYRYGGFAIEHLLFMINHDPFFFLPVVSGILGAFIFAKQNFRKTEGVGTSQGEPYFYQDSNDPPPL